jgi:hypothetical protein
VIGVNPATPCEVGSAPCELADRAGVSLEDFKAAKRFGMDGTGRGLGTAPCAEI